MLLELCVMAGVQIGCWYFAKKSSRKQSIADEPIADEPIADEPIADEPIADEPIADEPIADEPSEQEGHADVVDSKDADSPLPPAVEYTKPPLPVPQNPYGIPISLGSLALATLGTSVPLHLLSTGIISYTLIPVQMKAWKDWGEKRQINNDTLLSVFSVLALAGGVNPAIAFSYVSYELGSYLLRKTAARTQQMTFDSFSQLPRLVWLLKDGIEQQVPLSEVQVGDVVLIHSGEVVPVDGRIVEGQALVDQHLLTGEAQPVAKEMGDWLLASTVVATGRVRVETTKTGADTNVAQIARMLTEIAQTKPEVLAQGEQWADQMAMPVLALAGAVLVGFGLPTAIILLNSGFGNRIRVLGPLSTLNFLNIATRRGILVQRGTALEQINRIDTVLFDKTGTLTLPTMKTGRVTTYHGYDEREILACAASAEQRQTHPIAKAILQTAEELQLDLPECEEGSYRIGYGVAVKRKDGVTIRVGNARFMEMEGISRPEQLADDVAQAQKAGESVVVVSLGDRVVGTIVIQAQVRPEALEIIQGLKERGVKQVAIVSGDLPGPTQALAESLGVDEYFAEVLPTDKANIVRTLQDQGRVVCFVGDGVNDSVAMQQADVSISLSGASTIATDCASIVLMDGSLKHLCELFDIATRLDSNMRHSVGILGAFAAINIGSAFVGMGIDGSVLLKALSTLMVIGNAALPLVELEDLSNQTPVEGSHPPESWFGDDSTAAEAF